MGREEGRRCASQPSAGEREDRAARRREERRLGGVCLEVEEG
jgi:hypothetical protein